MTDAAEEARQPDRPPHRRGHRAARHRARHHPPGASSTAAATRDAAYIRRVIDVQRKLELGSRAVLLGSALPAGLGARHGRPLDRQDPREHGDRAQHPARPVGLDARPEDPLHDVGVGHGQPGRAVEALAQRAAPHLHEHRRQGQRPRLRHHARRRGPALAPAVPRPAALELHQRLLLRVRHRGLRPRARHATWRIRRSKRPAEFRAQRQGGAAARSASRRPRTTSCNPVLALPFGAFLPTLAANFTANVVRNLWSHSVIMCGHFPEGVETFEQRVDPRRRDPRRVVPAPDARLGQHLRLARPCTS